MKRGAGLVERAGSAGLPVEPVIAWQSAGADTRLTDFFDLRARWASTHNLSGPRALGDPWGADLIDGLAAALVSPADRLLVDVGAGSGIPGLVVACVQPERPIVLVEPLAKRTAFLRSVTSRLGLSRVRVLRARWPAPLDQVETHGADVISRAVVDPAEWPSLAVRGGRVVGGVIRMLAARRPGFEPAGFTVDRAVDYDLGADGHRRIERWIRQGAD